VDKSVMARNLKRWRQWRGLTQQEMAARLEMEPGAYGHWEGGRVELRARDLVRIAFALKMPLGTLMQALEFPIEDRVLSPGQWVDIGAPTPETLAAEMEGNTSRAGGGSTPEDALSHVRDAPTRRGSGRFLPSFSAPQPVLA
jgi:transcriptional regulator with XRE-family HTH domain